MKYRKAFAAILIALPLVLGADSPIKSLKARDARATYLGELKRAQAEYREKKSRAAKSYVDSLKQALAGAMQSGDLDDAVAIRAQMKAVEGAASEAEGLVIEKVMYSFEEKAVDLTAQVRAKVQNDVLPDALSLPGGIKDPAPYKNKAFTVRGTYGGKEFYLSVHTSPFDDGGVWFGISPPPGVAMHFADSGKK